MGLRDDVRRAIKDAPYDAYTADQVGAYYPEADAALAVMAAEHSRRIEHAMARINEVRVRLDYFRDHPDKDETLVALYMAKTLTELRTSLLAAMTELQGMLPAERGSEWAKKVERQS